jgi:hypothetical protein
MGKNFRYYRSIAGQHSHSYGRAVLDTIEVLLDNIAILMGEQF